MERDEADRRMRKVHAGDRLRLLFGEYQRFLFEMLVDPRSDPTDAQLEDGGRAVD